MFTIFQKIQTQKRLFKITLAMNCSCSNFENMQPKDNLKFKDLGQKHLHADAPNIALHLLLIQESEITLNYILKSWT